MAKPIQDQRTTVQNKPRPRGWTGQGSMFAGGGAGGGMTPNQSNPTGNRGYGPTNVQTGSPTTQTNNPVQQPAQAAPHVVGAQPTANNSMSDTLRSMVAGNYATPADIPWTPRIQLGSGDANNSMSDTLRSMVAGNYATPADIPWTPQQSNGFGSMYRGWSNRGGGGGGGYGGGYGGDGANNPWMNYMMGLNNWQI